MTSEMKVAKIASPIEKEAVLFDEGIRITGGDYPIVVDTLAEAEALATRLADGRKITVVSDSSSTPPGLTRHFTTLNGDLSNPTSVLAGSIQAEGGLSIQEKLNEIVAGAATQVQIDNSIAAHSNDIDAHPDLAVLFANDAAVAEAAKTEAQAARDAALLSRGVFASTADALSKGVASLASVVAGSGGTNGTFDLAFSGGAGTGAAGVFVVAGGAVVSTTITATGRGYTSAPTVSFAASSGLTGASATAVIANNADVGEYFSVPATGSNYALVLYRVDSGPVAVEVARYSNAEAFDELYRDRLLARRAAFLTQSIDRKNYAKRAAILVLLGQSNNVPREAAISGSVSRDVYMPVSGNSTTYWPYNSLNAEFCGNWDDLASAGIDVQGASENPGSGMALAMLGGTFSRVYMCSVALGSTGVDTLNSKGFLRNCYAVINRLSAIALADGFEPVVVLNTHHGETDALMGMSEDDYYSKAWEYYRTVQGFAAYAMGDVSYDAPIVFHMPIAYGTFASAPNMRNVARAVVRLARDLPGGILLGGSYQFAATDGVHHTNVAIRQKGEYAGMLLRDYFAKGEVAQCLQIVDAVWSGTTVTVTFSKEINYDTSLPFGTSLNSTNALGGFEFLDDGAFIQVMSIAVQGRKAVLTLQSAPVGITQTVQIASQTMSGTPSTFQTIAGSQIRANYTGAVGIYDHTKTYHELAAPQAIEVRP